MHLKKEIATAVAAAATFSLSLSPYLSFTANGLILSWRRRNCLLAWRTSFSPLLPPASRVRAAGKEGRANLIPRQGLP
jgi:hypothetical protein